PCLIPTERGAAGQLWAWNGQDAFEWADQVKVAIGPGLKTVAGRIQIDFDALPKAPQPIYYIGTPRQVLITHDRIQLPQNIDKKAEVVFKSLNVESILLDGKPLVIPKVPEAVEYLCGWGLRLRGNEFSVDMDLIQAAIKFRKEDITLTTNLTSEV